MHTKSRTSIKYLFPMIEVRGIPPHKKGSSTNYAFAFIVSLAIIVYMGSCTHWGCAVGNNICIGCGVVICNFCLKEPKDCKCNNRDNCCKSVETGTKDQSTGSLL
jgi:hypothetical protein